VKLFLLLQGNKLSIIYRSGKQYPWGTSLVVDYNIFGLCLITGLLSGYYILKRQIHFTYHVAVNLMALTIFFASVFSASRRTWFVLTVLILMIAGAFLKNLMKNIFLFLSTFKLKRSEFIKKLATGITLTAIIIGIVALVPKDISIKHTYQLTRIKNRFVNIINISEINLKRGSRYNRYDFAFQHINEYSILNLLIGNGSNYLKEFGQKFNGSGYDYPHNPILSAILQSGLIGALLIVGYICYCLFLYIKNLKFEETRFYFLVTLVLSFYYFISGNSVFSSKIYIFFTLLMPFAINRIFKTTD
jgi:O-antigen ligase